jgi:hypothetical protein
MLDADVLTRTALAFANQKGRPDLGRFKWWPRCSSSRQQRESSGKSPGSHSITRVGEYLGRLGSLQSPVSFSLDALLDRTRLSDFWGIRTHLWLNCLTKINAGGVQFHGTPPPQASKAHVFAR